MAIKNEDLGKEVRDAVAATKLNDGEVVDTVKIVVMINVKNNKTNSSYQKGAKGRTIENYNSDTEKIKVDW